MGKQVEALKTIVSVTPLSVLADSRTYKEASSFARFGYSSFVVEGETSPASHTPFSFYLRSLQEVRSIKKVPLSVQKGPSPKGMEAQRRRTIGIKMKQCLKVLPEGLKNPLRFLFFLCLYFYRYGLLPMRALPKASLYYLHAPYQFPAVFIFSWWYRVPFIYDAHDFYLRIEDDEYFSAFEKRWFLSFYRRMEGWCVKKAAAVVTVGQGIALLQQEVFGCHPIVIRNCHDERLDRERSQPLRESLGLNPEVFLLVTIGQAKKGQAIQEALRAMAELPEFVHLAFVGKNYEPFVQDCQSLRIEERVHFVSPVHPYEVVPFVRGADASLILYYARSVNYEYCLPNGFFQAVAAELPLLYPELTEISAIAKRYDLGIPIHPEEPASIRLAVKELLEKPAARCRFRENAKAAKPALSWEQEEKILEILILKVLSSRN